MTDETEMHVPRVSRTPAVGTVWKSYRYVRRIGAGGMGEVWEAENVHVPALKVAIKVILADRAGDADARARFLREVQILAALRHPGILQISDFDIDAESGMTSMVTELLVGEPLDKRVETVLHAGAQLTLPVIVTLAEQIAEALVYAHARNVVHRDIKPANVFVTTDGAAKLLDFGIARGAGTATLTSQEHMAPGTPTYYAPELLDGRPASGASDVYSLGILLWELCAGSAPFVAPPDADNPAVAILLQHRSTQAPDIRTRRRDVPDSVADLLGRMLDKDPARRPSPSEIARVLRSASSSALPIGALAHSHGSDGAVTTTTGTIARALPPADRSRSRVLVAATVASAVVAIAAVFGVVVSTTWTKRCAPGEKIVDGGCVAIASPLASCAADEVLGDGGGCTKLAPPEPDAGTTTHARGLLGTDRNYVPRSTVAGKTLAGFWLAKNETTVADWRACQNAGACEAPSPSSSDAPWPCTSALDGSAH
ncbi:MAG TPA: serine/threonine-protein kinase, partial [Myxococcota bacterium]